MPNADYERVGGPPYSLERADTLHLVNPAKSSTRTLCGWFIDSRWHGGAEILASAKPCEQCHQAAQIDSSEAER